MRTLLAILVCTLPLLAQAPYPPEPLAGSLVIVGGGKMPPAARDEFIKLAGGAEKARIVVIPTASNDADDAMQAESFLKQWKEAQVADVKLFHTRDSKQANDEAFLKPLNDATGIWFSGGDQSRIVKAYGGTLVEKAFHKRFAAGIVLGGTSAGAAIMSNPMIEGGAEEAKTGPGLGFLPGILVDQHFTQRKREKRLAGWLEKNPTYAGLGIDESTAVMITQGRIGKVVGEGSAYFYLAKSSTKPASVEKIQVGKELDVYQMRRAAHFRALKEPFPALKAAEPVVPKGSLMIVGGGGAAPSIWEKFVELSGGPDKTIVVVSTANEDPVPLDPGEAKALRKAGAKDVQILHTRDRKVAETDKFSKVLETAGGVWFSGGRQWRFVDSYEDTLALKRFRGVLERGGAIGGSSAGASIQSEFMPRGHPLGNAVMAAEGYERGFGFLPGCAVDQHFFKRKRTDDMLGLMKQYPQLLGIGIDEGTAIVVKGSTAEVIGATKVGFFDAGSKPKEGEEAWVEVKSGESYDLKGRKKK